MSAAQPNHGGHGDAFAAKLIEPKRIHFSHFAAGSGAGASLTGQILLVNPHPLKRAGASLQIRDDAGVPMTIDLNGTVVRGGTDVEIAPLGVASLRSVGFSPPQAGSISILSDRDLAGVILFGGSTGLAGIADTPLLKRFAAPVRTRNQVINTGIAFTNLDGEQTVELELRNQQGTVVARSNLNRSSPLE